MKRLILLLLLLTSTHLFAQDNKPSIDVSGFLDVYYAYDFNEPRSLKRQPYLYNHNRHNEFNVNLGLIKIGIYDEKYRSTLALQTGAYGNDNYSEESGLLKSVFEATVGVSLNNDNTLWLDAGVLPSHIGFESAISMDNYTLSRSLSAENSPYFLTGAKLTYNPNDKLELAALVTNGWQRIQRVKGNSLLSYGTQAIYQPTDRISINWSTFIGTDDDDYNRRMRYFSNLYTQLDIGERFHVIGGIDIGAQQTHKGSETYNLWYTPTVIGYWSINELWGVGARGEYYQDEYGVIVYDNFETYGFSTNIDYSPTSNMMFRVEARHLDNLTLLTSLAIKI